MPYFGRTTLAHVLRHISDRPSAPEFRGKNCAARSTSRTRPPRRSERPATLPLECILGKREPAAGNRHRLPNRAGGYAPEGWSRLEGLTLRRGGPHARGATGRRAGPRPPARDPAPRPEAGQRAADRRRPAHAARLQPAPRTRSSADAAERAAIGGTLPYMAPEQMEAFRTGTGRLDERCDIFGLGVILFELLTGRHPFPVRKGTGHRDHARDDRRPAETAARPRGRSTRRSPRRSRPSSGSASHPNPADRYQTAEKVREDIDRHLQHLPLKWAANPSTRELVRKWAARTPRLSSSATVAAVAVLLWVPWSAVGLPPARAHPRPRSPGAVRRPPGGVPRRPAFLDDRNRSGPRLDEGWRVCAAYSRLRRRRRRFTRPTTG